MKVSVNEKKVDDDNRMLQVEWIKAMNQKIQSLHKDLQITQSEFDRTYTEFERIQSSKLLTLTRKSYWKKTLRTIASYMLGRRNWKRLYSPTYKSKQASNDLKGYIQSLYEDGFTETVVNELEQMYISTSNKYVKRAVAWELLFWHANKQTKVGAKQALLYFFAACHGEKDITLLQQKLLVSAECMVVLGLLDAANELLDYINEVTTDDNVYLAKANATENMNERINYMNKVFTNHQLEPITLPGDAKISYSNLDVTVEESIKREEKVSIIVPAYNAADLIELALESLMKQTWHNIEIIVVDDHSTDDTYDIVAKYVELDQRIILLQTPVNSGAYTARNIGLQHATGGFITINDADDWSHPRKIEIQMNHLLTSPNVIANTSELCRVTENLYVYRRGTRGRYLFSNMSSLLFRAEPVRTKLGYWDSVRFAADGEFKRRMIRVFGPEAVVDLNTGPLSLALQSENSLTANSAFGYHGAFLGARKEYVESFEYHYQIAKQLHYPFPMTKRLFPVPAPMEPSYNKGKRFIDIVLIADFTDITSEQLRLIEKQIDIHQQNGYRTGLVHMPTYNRSSHGRKVNEQIRQLINGNSVQMIVYGEQIKCNLIIIHHCRSLENIIHYIPELEPLTTLVIVDESIGKKYNRESMFSLRKARNNHLHYFNAVGNWFYLNDSIKEEVQREYKHEIKYIPFRKDNWLIDGANNEKLYEERIKAWDVKH